MNIKDSHKISNTSCCLAIFKKYIFFDKIVYTPMKRLVLKSFYIFKIWKNKLHSGWAAVGRKPGQAEGNRPAFAACYCTHTIATPAPASETGVRHHDHDWCARYKTRRSILLGLLNPHCSYLHRGGCTFDLPIAQFGLIVALIISLIMASHAVFGKAWSVERSCSIICLPSEVEGRTEVFKKSFSSCSP